MVQKEYNPRRTFSVKSQLVGKLGQQGYGQLLQGLEGITGPVIAGEPARPKRRRRGGRGRKPVTA